MRKLTLAVLASLLTVGTAQATNDPSNVYVARRVEGGMPSRIVLGRGCNPAEDSLARLRMVKYVPGDVVRYRCIEP